MRLWFLSWISLSSSFRDSSMTRYARRRSCGESPSKARVAVGRGLTAVAFMSGHYIISAVHEPFRRGQFVSLGRARAREGHRDDFAEDHHRRARDAGPDLPEKGRARAHA